MEQDGIPISIGIIIASSILGILIAVGMLFMALFSA